VRRARQAPVIRLFNLARIQPEPQPTGNPPPGVAEGSARPKAQRAALLGHSKRPRGVISSRHTPCAVENLHSHSDQSDCYEV
jgi:hypothetical protein